MVTLDRRCAAGLALAVAVTVTGCGLRSDAASWALKPSQAMSATTTTLTAVVTRIGCSSGIDGRPEAPDIGYETARIVLTFTIKPNISSGDGQGTPGVEYEVGAG